MSSSSFGRFWLHRTLEFSAVHFLGNMRRFSCLECCCFRFQICLPCSWHSIHLMKEGHADWNDYTKDCLLKLFGKIDFNPLPKILLNTFFEYKKLIHWFLLPSWTSTNSITFAQCTIHPLFPFPPPACTLPFCLGLQPCTTTLVVQWCWRPASSRRYRRLPMILLLSWPTASHESGVESQPQSWPEDSMMLKAPFAAALNWCWRPASQLADRTAEPIINDH